jgi:hypothetical protein
MSEPVNKFLWNIHTALTKNIKPKTIEDQRFLTLALCGEVGELANLAKKQWRGDNDPEFDSKFRDELGDIYAYLILFGMAFDFPDLGKPSFEESDHDLYYQVMYLVKQTGHIAECIILDWDDNPTPDEDSIQYYYETSLIALWEVAFHLGIDLDKVLHEEIVPKIQARWGHLVNDQIQSDPC